MKRFDFRNALVALAICGAITSTSAQQQTLSDEALRQIRALHDEKESRTPAQQKMDSQLIYAAKQNRGQAVAANVPLLKHGVKFKADGRVLVDLKANVTDQLLGAIRAAGGEVVNSHPQFESVRALVPLAQIEILAALPDLHFIRPADECETLTGSLNSEGDNTHAAAIARANFSVSGSGIKVGVLSDSIDGLATSQASGDLGTVTVLSGQGGSGTGEGTALLEIIHDLAPGAQLYFATAFNGQSGFAQNILNLRAAGCDIIVDDVGYFNESPFQDGIIAQAVNTITTAGGLYFSSAGNSGNQNDGTSGTWEGDFADGGAATSPVNGKAGRIHNFGGGTFNTVTAGGSDRRVDLFWADPLGASTNDYDLYVLNSTGTSVLRSSTTTQNGFQDPYEAVGTLNVGERIVIVRASGTNRFLHLETGRGTLSISTAGHTHGHNSATNAYCVAATSALNSYPGAFSGGVANPVETFNSDGPRRVFYQANGTHITPGNYSSTGGAVRQKPDITAADGVKTAVSGFNPFYGTSAAAPHAAAVAALLKSYNNLLTPAQIRAALTATALDIEAVGYDRDSGSGIVMAQAALQFISAVPAVSIAGTSLIAEGCAPANGVLDPNEVVTVNFTLTNSVSTTVDLVATLLTTNGVSSPSSPQSYGSLTAGSPAVTRPFTFTAGGTCADICTAVFQLQDGGTNIGIVTNSFRLGALVSSSYSSGGVAVPIPDNLPAGVEVPILVAEAGVVADVNVRVRLNHPFDADLVLALIHPDGTVVTLASKRGNAGDNFGSGDTNCSGTFTVFDDTASTPINSGVAPFAGSYKPAQLLSTLNGKPVTGTWKLRVADTGGGDIGTLYCFQLEIARQEYICCSSGNAAPTLSGIEGPTLSYVENQPATAITATLTAGDDGNLTNATVCITSGFVSGEDVLALIRNPKSGVSAVYSGNVLTLTGTANAASYQAALRRVTYANSSGNPTFATRTVTFAVKDAGGLASGNQSRNIAVTAVNVSPVANDVLDTTSEDTARTITLSGSDAQTCELTFSIVSNPGHGSLGGPTNNFTCVSGSPNRDTNSIVYTPAANYHGPDSFSYQVNDGTADSTPATVTLTVDSVNDTPSFTKGSDQSVLACTGAQSVGGWATNISPGPADESSQAIDFIVTNNNNALFSVQPALSPAGTLTYTLAANSNGVATVSVRIHDNGGTGNSGVDISPAQFFTIMVTDTENPVITCSSNLVLTADLGRCSRSNVTFTVNATDNCSVTNLVSGPPSGSTFPVGVTTVTNTAFDASGNTSSCTFTVTVTNTEPLTITCPTNLLVNTDAGRCFATGVSLGTPLTTNDSCGVLTVTNDAPEAFPVGTNWVTWTAVDTSGKTITCLQMVIVSDATPPVLTCASNRTVECGAAWSFDEPTALDVCCGTNLTLSILSTVTNGDFCQMIITRTWQATDCYSNSATCNQTVTLAGAKPPVLAVSLSNGLVTLSWSSVPERTNWVEYNNDLGGTNWIVLTNVTFSGSQMGIADDPISTNAQRFYRVRVQ